MIHTMPQLPYAANALSPVLSQETIEFHYGKHLQAYINNINQLVVGTPFENLPLHEIIQQAEGPIFNNAAQAWNHILYFLQFTPTPVAMTSRFSQLLETNFGSVEAFKKQFAEAAAKFFGSGWVWLTMDKEQRLQIVATANAGNPLTQGLHPLCCIDVWEHAYYIDYRNRRPEYIEKFWNILNWEYVEQRMTQSNDLLCD